MCCNLKALLPALALLLAGGALVAQNLPAVSADVPATAAVQPTAAPAAADAAGPVTVGTWQETGNVRGRPPGSPTTPVVHTVNP